MSDAESTRAIRTRNPARTDLTAEQVRSLYSYDPATGIFRNRAGRKGRAVLGRVVGCSKNDGYLVMGIHRVTYLAHRLAWLHFYGEWPRHTIDHVNGVRTDNRIANLRDVPLWENHQNRARSAKTGYPGVSYEYGKYRARVRIDGRDLSLGSYETAQQAHAAVAARQQQKAGRNEKTPAEAGAN